MKHRQRWMKKVYRLFCKYLQPETQSQRENLRQMASAMAAPENAYLYDGVTPREAVYEEIQAGL